MTQSTARYFANGKEPFMKRVCLLTLSVIVLTAPAGALEPPAVAPAPAGAAAAANGYLNDLLARTRALEAKLSEEQKARLAERAASDRAREASRRDEVARLETMKLELSS